MLNHNSYILILEGVDASGKFTVSKEILKILKEADFIRDGKSLEFHLDSFPTSSPSIGGVIKKMLNSDITTENRELLASLFAVDRYVYNLENKISELGRNHFFLFDRSYPSNFAYNLEIGLDKLIKMEDKSFFGDKVIILDVDPAVSVERRPDRRDKFETNIDYLVKVRNNYLELAKRFNWIVLDGNKPAKEIATQIIDIILSSNSGIEGNLN